MTTADAIIGTGDGDAARTAGEGMRTMTVESTKAAAKQKRGEVSTFVGLLESHDAGRTERDLSRAMREALQQAEEVAGNEGTATAEVSLTMTLVRASNGRTEVKAKYTVKAPQPKHPTTVLHAAEGGTLSARDPGQTEMKFRDSDGGGN